jgi:pyruvate kinase
MIQGGMNVARLNFSHGTREEHAEVIRTIRDFSAALDIPVAILIDLPGPKPRTGRLKEKRVYIKVGDNFSLTSERVLGDEHMISVDFPAFFNDIRAGDSIFLNDGAIQLKVISTTNIEVNCKVVVGGLLSDNKGINVPGVRLNVSSITSEDLKHLAFAVEQGVDFVAISFVHSVADVLEIKKILQKKRANIAIIAKIEKREGVNDIDRIIAEVDGIMIARGDLGIEIPLKRVPIVQKEIIRKCNQAGKPVIVATQMLESMVGATRPTRAEVSDVANAIFDRTDAVMLSGETAVGKYPVRAVKTMVSIITETEKVLPYERILREKSEQVTAQTDDAISYAACHMSQQLGASCIVAYTSSGSTALRVSKYRPEVPVLAITPNASIVRSLALSWGIEPHLATEPSNVDIMFQEAAQLALQNGIAKRGELVIITAGIPMGTPGSTNVVKVHRVE